MYFLTVDPLMAKLTSEGSRMRYIENSALVFDPEDFGARVVDGLLQVPTSLFQALEHGRCRGDVELALSFAVSFPTNIGSWFALGPDGVKRALGGLLTRLNGHIDAEYLTLTRGWIDGSISPPKREFGALPPAGARHRPKPDPD